MINLTLKEKKAFRYLKQRLQCALGSDLLEIKLFGSRARGEARRSSDYDILLVLKKRPKLNEPQSEIIAQSAYDVLDRYGIFLSTVVFGEKDLWRSRRIGTPFTYWVDKEGIKI